MKCLYKLNMFQNSWSMKIPEMPVQIAVASLPKPSLIYQGKSNQLSVYTNNQVHNLPIRKQVIALNSINQEHVLVLTRFNLNCFDLLNNEQRFSLQFENAQKLFVIDNKIYVTSGSSLYCYDNNGQELYVNHVSAPITAIAKVDKSMNSQSDDIVIATTQMTMFRYSKLNIVFDFAKIIGKATSLCWVGKGVMVGTEEGPIAFYENKKYKWKAKSIHSVFKIVKFKQVSQYNQNAEFQTHKQDKIIVIRNDGNIQIRDWQNGATLAKTKTGESIIDVFVTDFRAQGFNQVVCALQSGNIRAFNVKDEKLEVQQDSKTATAEQTVHKGDQIENLNKIKQELLYKISELKNKLGEEKTTEGDNNDTGDILSPNFKMIATLDYKEGLILEITATNGYISGLTFQQPIMPIIVDKMQSLKYKFLDSSSSAGQIICQVLVHSSISSTKFEVRKLPIHLPKFWKWGLNPSVHKQISGKLKFKLIERNGRYLLWMKQCFFMNLGSKQEERLENLNQMKFRFYNWYEQKEMQLVFSQKQGTVIINCDCLKTMGNIFQDLINYIGLKHLNSQLQFPQQKQKVKQLLDTVEKLSQTKVSMSTQLADSINSIKFLLVKGESARVVGSMNSFRKTYGQIMEQNRNLITQIEKKNQNTKNLTETLKSINNFINQIANVRYGQPKSQVIAKCREAIKTKKFPIIYSIMEKGSDYS